MNNPVAFRSMLSAVAFILGEDSDQYFSMVENRQWVADAIEELPSWTPEDMKKPGMAEICGTLMDYAVKSPDVVGVSVDSEKHMGCILAHYTHRGEIVRFVAIKS